MTHFPVRWSESELAEAAATSAARFRAERLAISDSWAIPLRIPVDVVDSLKEISPWKGLSGYQTLLKAYISEGLRQDEAEYSSRAPL